MGGLLPRAKITPEIAEIRGIPRDRDCVSPAAHAMFRDADGLLDFAEAIAAETGLPFGIKSAVGDLTFWEDLARLMATGTRGVDYINIDGGEGGTGAGPLVFADHVALPFKVGFSRVLKVFTGHANRRSPLRTETISFTLKRLRAASPAGGMRHDALPVDAAISSTNTGKSTCRRVPTPSTGCSRISSDTTPVSGTSR